MIESVVEAPAVTIRQFSVSATRRAVCTVRRTSCPSMQHPTDWKSVLRTSRDGLEVRPTNVARRTGNPSYKRRTTDWKSVLQAAHDRRGVRATVGYGVDRRQKATAVSRRVFHTAPPSRTIGPPPRKQNQTVGRTARCPGTTDQKARPTHTAVPRRDDPHTNVLFGAPALWADRQP
jgi:hypothetical protein